jgi:hypothetical protein
MLGPELVESILESNSKKRHCKGKEDKKDTSKKVLFRVKHLRDINYKLNLKIN